MTLREYLAGKAVALCGIGIAALCWGVFAYLTGAAPVLLWGSEAFLAAAVCVRYGVGYGMARKRLARLQHKKNGLPQKYLLAELLDKPHDPTEREYYDVMKTVSRSAVGAVQDAAREKEEYCALVEQWVHEIKTPLTACSLICDNGGDTVKLRRELKRADDLTDTVLYYARLRSPQNDTVITRVHMADVAAEAIKSRRELLTAAKISVKTSGDFCVHTDGKAVRFILQQLLMNCAKYCGGCRITITAQEGTLTVSDDGPGIASHELPRIFERGYTGEAGRKAGSTGMGLYIVREMCDRLHIDLRADSQLGKGTTFTFRFALRD